MPARGDGLQHEAGAREAGCAGEEAFVQLEGGELVPVGGEDAVGVRGGEPGGGKESRFYGAELGVHGARDTAGVVNDGFGSIGGERGGVYKRLIRDRRFSRNPYWRGFCLVVRFEGGGRRLTTVFTNRAAVDIRIREPILSGTRRAFVDFCR